MILLWTAIILIGLIFLNVPIAKANTGLVFFAKTTCD